MIQYNKNVGEDNFMISAKITSIGADAISDEDNMAILFGESATPDLKKVAVIQKFTNLENQKFDLKQGDQIKIGQLEYEIKFVGSLVNNNLQTIGHTTLVFKELPEQPLESAIYLSSNQFPNFEVGEEIQYM
jgi:PTS system glucitol/sorbitol-specific IIA component